MLWWFFNKIFKESVGNWRDLKKGNIKMYADTYFFYLDIISY
jgi:hypothetical protein